MAVTADTATRPTAAEAPVAPVLVIAALAAAAVAQGAYHPPGQRVVGLILVAAVLIAGRDAWHDHHSPPVIACAALATWSLISAAVAGDVRAAWSTIALLGGVVAVITIGRHARETDRMLFVDGLLVVGVLVAVSGWIGLAWRLEPWAIEDPGLWRAASTITYANATAGFLVPLFLISVTKGTTRASYVLLVGIGATLSRGGAVALAVGLAVLVVALGLRATLRATVPAAAGAAVALAGLVPSMQPDHEPQPALALAAVVAGLVVVWLCTSWPRLLLVAAVPLVIVAATVDWSGRISVSSSDRVEETRAALELATEYPLTGVGPGNAPLIWQDDAGAVRAAKYVHNEYLQVLVEFGAIGLGLVVLLLGSCTATTWRRHNVGATAALAAFATHSLFDFLWHVPLIPLTVAVLVSVSAIPTIKEESL